MSQAFTLRRIRIERLRDRIQDVTLSSVTIQRGALVVAVLGSANHDESVFRDPRRSIS